jgi:hypothetical protein
MPRTRRPSCLGPHPGCWWPGEPRVRRHGLHWVGAGASVGANQVGIRRDYSQSEIIDHPPGDLGRGQHLDLRLDRVHEEVHAATSRWYCQLPGDFLGVVDLDGAAGLVHRDTLGYGPDGRRSRHAEDQHDQPESAGDYLPIVGDVRGSPRQLGLY